MHSDLELIVKEFPADYDCLRVYALGDIHVGSEQFDEESTKKIVDYIYNDPFACVVLCGDLADLGLKNSKTNIYNATMSIREQLDYVYKLFLPIADKITACVGGNHELRITKEVGTCPLYDLCVRWDCPEVYRENLAITKYSFGLIEGQKKRNTFIGITTHGSTRNKHRKFTMTVEGADFSISGHVHDPSYSPRGKLRVNSRYNIAKHVPFKEIVVDAHLKPGGYALKNEYEIAPPVELQYFELSSYRETKSSRNIHKVIDYHAMQL